MQSFKIEEILVPAGTVTVTLVHPDENLVVPDEPTVQSIGDVVERIESEPNIIEMSSVEIEVVDDYSLQEYPRGFWYYIITESEMLFDEKPEILLTLDEGDGDSYLFRGRVEKKSVRWTEHSLGNSLIRTCSFTLVNSLKVLEDLNYEDLITELLEHRLVDDEQLPARPIITSVERGGNAMNDGVTYRYRIAARNVNGEYEWSGEAETDEGPAVLNSDGYLVISFSGVTGAIEYAVYRTYDGSGSCGTGYIGKCSGTVFNDEGFIAEGEGQSKKSCRQFILLKDVFLVMMQKGFGQEYNPSAVTIQNCDFHFKRGAVEVNLETLYILARYNTGTLDEPMIVSSPFLDTENDRYWGKRFRSPLSILGYLCRQFGVIPAYSYNLNQNGHTILLFTRGRSGDEITGLGGREFESFIFNDNYIKPKSILLFRSNDREDCYGTPNAEEVYDVESGLDFLVQSTPELNEYEKIWIAELYGPGVRFNYATGVLYYNYPTQEWIEESDAKTMQAALVCYLWNRMTPSRRMIERRYDGLKATEGEITSHTVVRAGMRMSIEDGLDERIFYANEIRKNVFRDELLIQWLEE
jgi:hypothetical protein